MGNETAESIAAAVETVLRQFEARLGGHGFVAEFEKYFGAGPPKPLQPLRVDGDGDVDAGGAVAVADLILQRDELRELLNEERRASGAQAMATERDELRELLDAVRAELNRSRKRVAVLEGVPERLQLADALAAKALSVSGALIGQPTGSRNPPDGGCRADLLHLQRLATEHAEASKATS